MTKPDFSEYERRRAEDHELFWRLTATHAAIRFRLCRFRQCRRLQACCGPMLASDHQKIQVRAQQEIGLSGQACATLPRCIAHIPETQYAAFRRYADSLSRLRGDHTDAEIFLWVASAMRISRQPPGQEGPKGP